MSVPQGTVVIFTLLVFQIVRIEYNVNIFYEMVGACKVRKYTDGRLPNIKFIAPDKLSKGFCGIFKVQFLKC